jgi:hypothetical protein
VAAIPLPANKAPDSRKTASNGFGSVTFIAGSLFAATERRLYTQFGKMNMRRTNNAAANMRMKSLAFSASAG